MRRVLLELEYYGKGFFGWQRQGPNRTVQATVEVAVADLVGTLVSVQSAGRTDRGVHALAMPAHVDIDSRLEPRELLPALNHRLPRDVAVKRVRDVDPRFHARFDALAKTYRYTILNTRARSPMLGDRAHQVPRPLDLDDMLEAAAMLVGKHDFASFRTNPEEGPEANAAEAEDGPDDAAQPATTADLYGPAAVQHGDFTPPPWRKPRPEGTVRTIFGASVYQKDGLLLLELRGDGFLRGMVRAVAGSLVEIGLGKRPPGWIRDLLQLRDRREAGANLPPHGLTLLGVDYPAEPFEGRADSYGSA
jgi:tRNA pseudouridine38-40 synthase